MGRVRNITTFTALAGQAQQTGQSQVQAEYAQKLVSSKIVVVAQKDDWEDHYRLMEALVSGAMVLSNEILTPPQGLTNGQSVVYYCNQLHRRQLMMYYLNHGEDQYCIAQEAQYIYDTASKLTSYERSRIGRILSSE